MVDVARPFPSRAHGLAFLGACLIGFAFVGCSKPIQSKNANTGGSTGTGGEVGSGGVVGSGAAPDAHVAPDASTCDQLSQAARAQFGAYLDSTASEACQVDSDCTRLSLRSLACIAPCGQLVGAVDTSAITAAASRVCTQYFAAGCPDILSFCMVARIRCDHGQCVDSVPGSTAFDAAADSTVDATSESACVSPSVGAACASDQIACATCCTDHWTCADGAWQNQFLGCLPAEFLCGDPPCWQGQSYCDTIPGVDGGELPHPTIYTCKTLPSPCYGQRCPTCDCLKEAGIAFSACTADAVGNVFVTR